MCVRVHALMFIITSSSPEAFFEESPYSVHQQVPQEGQILGEVPPSLHLNPNAHQERGEPDLPDLQRETGSFLPRHR